MPEKLSQINAAEIVRRDKAARYERATLDLGNAERAVERFAPLCVKFQAQVATITTAMEAVDQMDTHLVGLNGFLCREIVNKHLSVALDDQTRRLADTAALLAKARADVPRYKALVKELS